MIYINFTAKYKINVVIKVSLLKNLTLGFGARSNILKSRLNSKRSWLKA